MAGTPTLGITARAKDEVSGPIAQAADALDKAAERVRATNGRLLRSEQEKRKAYQLLKQSQRQAAEQAAQLRTALSGLTGAVSVLGQRLGAVPSQLVLLETGLEGVRALAGRVASALGAGFSAAVAGVRSAADQSSKFGLKIAQVASIVDDADGVTGALREAVLRLSGTYGAAPVEQATALYEAVSAGATKANEAISLLTVANKVAVAGQASVPDAIDGLTTAINAYGAGMDEALPFADAFFVAVRDGKMTVSQFAKSLGTVVGNARNAGVGFDELAAGIAAITLAGNSADEATTALNQAIASVIKPSKEAREEAARLGIEFNKAAISKAGGFGRFLQNIAGNAKKTSETIGRLFGDVRSIKAVDALLLNSGQTFERLFGNMANKAGATEEALERITGTLEFQRQRLEAVKSTATIVLGDIIGQSQGVAGAYEGVNDVLSIFTRKMLDAKYVLGGSRIEMRRFVREGVADFVDGFATVVRAIPLSTKLLGFFGDAAKSVIMASPLGKYLRDAAIAMRAMSEASKNAGGLREIAETINPDLKKSFEELFDGGSEFATFLEGYARSLRGTAEDAENLKKEQEQLAASQIADIKKMMEEEKALRAQRAADAKADADEEAYKAFVAKGRADLAEMAQRSQENEARANKVIREAEAALRRDQKKAVADAKKDARELAKTQEEAAQQIDRASSSIAGSLAGGFVDALTGARNFGDYVEGMLERLTVSLVESGLTAAIKGLFSAATGGASGGGFLSSVLGFFGFAKGGVVGTTRPQRFARGGLVDGPTGIDRVPAAIIGANGVQPAYLTRREGVLPAGLTDELRRVLRVPVPATTSAPAASMSAPSFNIVIQGADAGADWDRIVATKMVPALRRACSAGALDFLNR